MSEDGTAERGYDRVSLPLGKIMINNFLGGLAWGFGTFIGATILVGLVIWILAQTGTLNGLTSTIQQSFLESFQKGLNSLQVPGR